MKEYLRSELALVTAVITLALFVTVGGGWLADLSGPERGPLHLAVPRNAGPVVLFCTYLVLIFD